MMVRHGEIWSVALSPTVANEQSETRPCIVLSTNRFNLLPIRQAIVVPLTSRDRQLPHHVAVQHTGELDRQSWAMCEGVRTVSTRRFGRRIGTATLPTVTALVDQLTMWLDPDR